MGTGRSETEFRCGCGAWWDRADLDHMRRYVPHVQSARCDTAGMRERAIESGLRMASDAQLADEWRRRYPHGVTLAKAIVPEGD